MNLDYEPLAEGSTQMIYAKRTLRPYLAKNWHFHPEFEILYIIEGQGMRVVGDHISNFTKGELVLIGKWLPHLWRHDTPSKGSSNAIYYNIKFLEDYNGMNIFSLPELSNIEQLLKKSFRGLLFNETVIPKVHDLITNLVEEKSAYKIINLLKILQILSEEKNVNQLSSSDFILPTQVSRESRLQKIVNYIFANYNRQISLEKIASVAYMTPTAFCRYFKSCTNKTFFTFLNEFRIGKACQLLINDKNSVKEICYEVGFNSLTNFNRTFKTFKKVTPTKYREQFIIKV
jgi:AraC-like DNA-binding protein